MSSSVPYDLICIGGGAAGFFTAIRYSELNPEARILILEKSKKVLSKVKISGGGRCNVTHGCFDPAEMLIRYPRGDKELRGPFHHFLCGDMMAWLSDHGVETKIEADGRVFPVSDSSQTIIDLFMARCAAANITILRSDGMEDLAENAEGWTIRSRAASYRSKRVMLATGSTPSVWRLLEGKGYRIVPPVPSLFTFNSDAPLLRDLAGLSVPDAQVKITLSVGGRTQQYAESGPLLITHWGLSGPAILKLSAYAARDLHALDYRFEVRIAWTDMDRYEVQQGLESARELNGKRSVEKNPLFGLPKRLWQRMCSLSGVADKTHAELSRVSRQALMEMLTASPVRVEGKSTFKEEFVTCGGVERQQIDFRTMQSRLHPGLYMAGEVIDIDAVTGGFNFQAAWTEGWLAAQAMATVDQST